MKKIAFFDFDGTITTKDSMVQFIFYCFGTFKTIKGFIYLSPIMIGYKLKIIKNHTAKRILLRFFFKNYPKKKFDEKAISFSKNKLPLIINRAAMSKIEWHQKKGHAVVVVTASIENWVKPWCDKKSLKLIATKLSSNKNNINTEIYIENCFGLEKVNRIKKLYDLSNYETIYAYGDSDGDREMLELADFSHYREF